MLKELGLWPEWRLREPQAGSPSAERGARIAEPEAQVAPPAVAARARTAPAAAKAEAGSDQRRAAIADMDWAQLKAAVASCTACPLHKGRTQAVFGVGDENADWLFVGEGPGAEEDARGEPFVGQAGKLLDNMMAAIALRRGDNVYIGNIVKCRPPGNRNPEPSEAHACEPFLHRQIELLRPKLIIALGKVAALNLLQTDASIASLRGKVHHWHDIPLIVTYHPAYLLRNLPDKAKSWQDLVFAVETFRGL
jgi:DNA polymerase